jgi:hypothetical protein
VVAVSTSTAESEVAAESVDTVVLDGATSLDSAVDDMIGVLDGAIGDDEEGVLDGMTGDDEDEVLDDATGEENDEVLLGATKEDEDTALQFPKPGWQPVPQ